jgi:alanine racemase-like protein
MSLDLYVDGPRWRAHLRATADAYPGIVPVAKGNGYGFGLAGLARRTQWLGCTSIAVGTYREVGDVQSRFDGDIVVLEPWRALAADLVYGPRIIHTVGRAADLAELGSRDDRPRVVLEGLTSMRRHGFTATDLRAASGAARGVRLEGHALHLPLGQGHVREVESWVTAAPARRWYLSHVTRDELTQLAQTHPDLNLRPRIGTELWLGDRAALSARATVLDAHPVKRGDRVGYRRRRIIRDGTLLVVSGGTSHGIGLEGPSAAASPRHRVRSLAKGGLDAAGRSMSPYTVSGRQRWFVEPPHMQVSLIYIPSGDLVPEVGEEVEVQVRFSTTTFDHIHLS